MLRLEPHSLPQIRHHFLMGCILACLRLCTALCHHIWGMLIFRRGLNLCRYGHSPHFLPLQHQFFLHLKSYKVRALLARRHHILPENEAVTGEKEGKNITSSE